MATDIQKNPYVGLRPFSSLESTIFFGRDREVDKIVTLVIAHPTLLLYGGSGVGKSSLLNAGIIPLLKKEGFEVLSAARVSGSIPSVLPSQNFYVYNTLLSWTEKETDQERLSQMHIAGFLNERKRLVDAEGLPSLRVAIFDQFEELFAYHPEHWSDREGFFKQIGQALDEDPLLRVVFAIREDYIAHLDPYAFLLPEKLRIRFRLERMRREAALSAIKKPLTHTKCIFSDGVAEKLVQELLRVRVVNAAGETVEIEGEFVEPAQIQVVCHNLWENLSRDVAVISLAHLGEFGDVNQVLLRFYESVIDRTVQKTGVAEKELREWFEYKLITAAGTRGVIFREQEYSGGIPNTAVEVLENLHIIRGELRAGSRWYELTHDRLIIPIQESNKTWKPK